MTDNQSVELSVEEIDSSDKHSLQNQVNTEKVKDTNSQSSAYGSNKVLSKNAKQQATLKKRQTVKNEDVIKRLPTSINIQNEEEKQFLKIPAPTKNMNVLNQETNKIVHLLKDEEREQHSRIDKKFHNMEMFQFETQLRELVGECIAPIRERVLNHNEEIAFSQKEMLKQAHKIELLEIIYRDHEEAKTNNSKKSPTTIFDSIKNKIADNAAECRRREHELQIQISNLQSKIEKSQSMQNIYTLKMDRISENMDQSNTQMMNLETSYSNFKLDLQQKVDKLYEDLNTKLVRMRMQQNVQTDELQSLKVNLEQTKQIDEKQDKMIEYLLKQVEKLAGEIERLQIQKQEQSAFMDLRKEVIDKVNKAIAKTEDVNSKIDSTDNYLARYLPFNSFCQVLETVKVVVPEIQINKKLRENLQNYEMYKTKELYQAILFDDGKPPKKFTKDFLVVGRKEINDVLQKDVRINSKNLRGMRIGGLALENTKFPNTIGQQNLNENKQFNLQANPIYNEQVANQYKNQITTENSLFDSAQQIKVIDFNVEKVDEIIKKGVVNKTERSKDIITDLLSGNASSELRDRIDDIKRAENEQKLNKLDNNQYQLQNPLKKKRISKSPLNYEFKLEYSEEEQQKIVKKIIENQERLEDEKLSKLYNSDGEASHKDNQSDMTFNLHNLNYVKQKLFDPEIQYLRKKFKEEFLDIQAELFQKFDSTIQVFKSQVNQDLSFFKALWNQIETEIQRNKKTNSGVGEILSFLINQIESHNVNFLKFQPLNMQNDLQDLQKQQYLLANDFKLLIENLQKLDACQQINFQQILGQLYPLKEYENNFMKAKNQKDLVELGSNFYKNNINNQDPSSAIGSLDNTNFILPPVLKQELMIKNIFKRPGNSEFNLSKTKKDQNGYDISQQALKSVMHNKIGNDLDQTMISQPLISEVYIKKQYVPNTEMSAGSNGTIRNRSNETDSNLRSSNQNVKSNNKKSKSVNQINSNPNAKKIQSRHTLNNQVQKTNNMAIDVNADDLQNSNGSQYQSLKESNYVIINRANSRQVIYHNKQQSKGSLTRDSQQNGLNFINKEFKNTQTEPFENETLNHDNIISTSLNRPLTSDSNHIQDEKVFNNIIQVNVQRSSTAQAMIHDENVQNKYINQQYNQFGKQNQISASVSNQNGSKVQFAISSASKNKQQSNRMTFGQAEKDLIKNIDGYQPYISNINDISQSAFAYQNLENSTFHFTGQDSKESFENNKFMNKNIQNIGNESDFKQSILKNRRILDELINELPHNIQNPLKNHINYENQRNYKSYNQLNLQNQNSIEQFFDQQKKDFDNQNIAKNSQIFMTNKKQIQLKNELRDEISSIRPQTQQPGVLYRKSSQYLQKGTKLLGQSKAALNMNGSFVKGNNIQKSQQIIQLQKQIPEKQRSNQIYTNILKTNN